MLNVLTLFGCIAFSIDVVSPEQETGEPTIVDTSDTQDVETGTPADSGEIPDTSDTEETDTQETDTPVDLDEYTNDDFMMGNYIELKNNLFLLNEPQNSHSLYSDRNFLRFNETWGFAVTLQPFDAEGADNMAGLNNQDGKELALFVSGNNIFTLQFVHVEEAPGTYRPIVRLVSIDGPNSNCAYMPIEQPYDSGSGGIGNIVTYSRADIVGGMRILARYLPNDPMNMFQLYINDEWTPAIEVELDPPADCGIDGSAGVGNVRFGVGVEYYDNGPNFHATEDIKAKVDNLMIFSTSNYCQPDFFTYFNPPIGNQEEPDPTLSYFSSIDCNTALQTLDGFHGWPMDPVMDDNRQINSNIIQDASELEPNPPNVVFNFKIRQGGLMNHNPVPPADLDDYFKVREVTE